jgi:predicted transcriptional regulator
MTTRPHIGRPRRGEAVRVTVSLRLDPALLERLDDAAERAERLRTECVEEAIEKWLDAETTAPPEGEAG